VISMWRFFQRTMIAGRTKTGSSSDCQREEPGRSRALLLGDYTKPHVCILLFRSRTRSLLGCAECRLGCVMVGSSFTIDHGLHCP
jgi:hypothetical protein